MHHLKRKQNKKKKQKSKICSKGVANILTAPEGIVRLDTSCFHSCKVKNKTRNKTENKTINT